jgi:protease-4
MKFFDILKNIFFLLIFLQFVPLLIDGIRKQYNQIVEPRTKVGVIMIDGVLSDSEPYTKQLTRYFKDPSIKAILIKMDSPGGAAGTGEAIYNEIISLKNAPEYHKKPIVTLVENTCASGGYYIACASDYIIAPATSLIGSIGATFPNIFFLHLHEFLAQHKIGYKPIYAGAYKNCIDPLTSATPEQEALLQGLLNDCYETFAQAVAKSRKLSLNAKDTWANGRIFTGKQAKDLGLIDENGSSYNAIKVIREKALIEGEIEWVKQPMPSAFSQLFSGNNAPDDDTSLLSSCVHDVCATLENRYCTNTVQ